MHLGLLIYEQAAAASSLPSLLCLLCIHPPFAIIFTENATRQDQHLLWRFMNTLILRQYVGIWILPWLVCFRSAFGLEYSPLFLVCLLFLNPTTSASDPLGSSRPSCKPASLWVFSPWSQLSLPYILPYHWSPLFLFVAAVRSISLSTYCSAPSFVFSLHRQTFQKYRPGFYVGLPLFKKEQSVS